MTHEDRHSRTRLLVGEDGLRRLAAAHVAVFGVGGVGSYAVEALARAGIGQLTLVDFDRVTPSNINRQLIALESTVGRPKVEVACDRVHDINPAARVTTLFLRADAPAVAAILDSGVSHVVDAIDHVADKAALLAEVYRRGLGLISCMGAANKLDPGGILVADIGETRECPLARAVRHRLRKLNISHGIRCVYSRENLKSQARMEPDGTPAKTRIQGSISHVPGLVGLTAAGVIIQDILGETRKDRNA